MLVMASAPWAATMQALSSISCAVVRLPTEPAKRHPKVASPGAMTPSCSPFTMLSKSRWTRQSPPRLPAPLHHHPDSALYLTHSTTNLSGGCSRRQCPRPPCSQQTRSNDLVRTTTLAGGRNMSASMLCNFMDSLYFFRLLALGGLCAHLYEYPPTNSTLSPIWATTVRRNHPLLENRVSIYGA